MFRLGPYFHREHRIIIDHDEAKGWSFLIESATIKKRFGYFAHDYQAHASAVEAIDKKLLADKAKAHKPKKRLARRPDACHVPAGAEHFGARLAWAIRAARTCKKSLARKSGIGQRQIQAWIDGEIHAPSLATIARLCDFLLCRPLWLQDGSGYPWVMRGLPDAKTWMTGMPDDEQSRDVSPETP